MKETLDFGRASVTLARPAAVLFARGAKRFDIRYEKAAKNGSSVEKLNDMSFGYEPTGNGVFVAALPHEFADCKVVRILRECECAPIGAAA